LGSGIAGVVEVPFRFTAAYIVGNRISGYIAKAISLVKDDDDASVKAYNKTKEACNKSFSHAVQGVAQNFTSLGTNIVSHNSNMRVANKIQGRLENNVLKVVEAAESVCPTTIAWAAWKKDPRYCQKLCFSHRAYPNNFS